MKKESKFMDLFRTNIRKISTVLFFALMIVVIVSMILDTAKAVIPTAVIIMLLAVVCIRMWQDSIVEIVIKDDIVELEFFDKSKRTIYLSAIIAVKETSSGASLILRDESELAVMDHPLKVTVHNKGSVSHELRKEDFPDTQFIKKK